MHEATASLALVVMRIAGLPLDPDPPHVRSGPHRKAGGWPAYGRKINLIAAGYLVFLIGNAGEYWHDFSARVDHQFIDHLFFNAGVAARNCAGGLAGITGGHSASQMYLA